MDCSISHRSKTTTNWRQAREYNCIDQSRVQIYQSEQIKGNSNKTKRRPPISSSNFVWALLITIVIIFTQLFIVNHYIGGTTRKHRLFNLRSTDDEANLLAKSNWFCHSFSHLNQIAELAHKFQVDLVIVDPDLLELLIDNDQASSSNEQFEFASSNGKTKQEASHKTIIHLAAINETSGGQPNLKLFYNALKTYYHMLKYQDNSETMAAEVYKRQSAELDDVQFDAIQDSSRLGREHEPMHMMMNFEISKIYTEFIAHVFILNTSQPELETNQWYSPKKCSGLLRPADNDNSNPFIVIHLFVLYNYEFQPDKKWIQSSLLLDEIDRHKLLAYGVHSIDFRVPLDNYYVHSKRKTSSLLETSSFTSPLKFDKPMNKLKILEPDRLLDYTNNTYLHCKQSSFNISALIDGNRRMSDYLMTLDAARPLKSERFHGLLLDQISIALKFMDVFSRSYGNFSYWLTGSTLLAYHKFCHLVVLPQTKQRERQLESSTDNDLLLLSADDYEEESVNDNTILELELGLFESELNSSMLNDLSEANMIGVTMISDWREPNKNGLVSFQVKDCPNLIFNLHFYRLDRDFYRQYYITNDNMIFNHKFRRRKSRNKVGSTSPINPLNMIGHHVFTIRNLELCWTRLDHLEPFKVPCDVHDHLRRIYVI